MIDEDDQPRSVSYWAQQWRMHRNRARDILKLLRKRYGAKMVWTVPGQNGSSAYQASVASLRPVQVLRVHRNMVVIVEEAGTKTMLVASSGKSYVGQRLRSADDREYVTREELAESVAKLTAEFNKLLWIVHKR